MHKILFLLPCWLDGLPTQSRKAQDQRFTLEGFSAKHIRWVTNNFLCCGGICFCNLAVPTSVERASLTRFLPLWATRAIPLPFSHAFTYLLCVLFRLWNVMHRQQRVNAVSHERSDTSLYFSRCSTAVVLLHRWFGFRSLHVSVFWVLLLWLTRSSGPWKWMRGSSSLFNAAPAETMSNCEKTSRLLSGSPE